MNSNTENIQVKETGGPAESFSGSTADPGMTPVSGKERLKDILIRAGKTFAQTALGCVIAGLSGADIFSADGAFWKGLLLSSLAAGLSAAWNSFTALTGL